MDNQDPKVFDVSKPGSGEPSATSRPIIVGHGNMIEDPMMKTSTSATVDGKAEDEDTADPTKVKAEPEEELAPHHAKTVEPPAGLAAAIEESSPEAAPKPAETDQPAGASDSLPAEEAKPKEKPEKVNEEEQARQEAVQKLIEGKQFVVHVGENKHQRQGKMLIVIALVILLLIGGAAAYLLK